MPVRPILAVHGARVPAPRGRTELRGVITSAEQLAEQRLPRHSS
uniref:Uncharacterized protein n=1 Tax=Streptomyces sp. NBC_00148 TaxID=2903626 RepID=A0AAU1M5M6_9ACTN